MDWNYEELRPDEHTEISLQFECKSVHAFNSANILKVGKYRVSYKQPCGLGKTALRNRAKPERQEAMVMCVLADMDSYEKV